MPCPLPPSAYVFAAVVLSVDSGAAVVASPPPLHPLRTSVMANRIAAIFFITVHSFPFSFYQRLKMPKPASMQDSFGKYEQTSPCRAKSAQIINQNQTTNCSDNYLTIIYVCFKKINQYLSLLCKIQRTFLLYWKSRELS